MEKLRILRRLLLMQNSQAYMDLIEQLNAVGSKKKDGYYPKLMEEIHDWERDQVEDIVWGKFTYENEADLAMFMPKLTKYDGIVALKTKMGEFVVPSEGNYNIAEVLYLITNEDAYLKLMFDNYNATKNEVTKNGFVSRLSRLANIQMVYDKLIDIYINDEDDVNQSTAIDGILFADGYLKSVDDLDEIMKNMQLLRIFVKDSTDERNLVIEKYKKGDFEHYKKTI